MNFKWTVVLILFFSFQSFGVQCGSLLETKVLKSVYRHGELFKIPYDQVFTTEFSKGRINEYSVIYRAPDGKTFEIYEVTNPQSLIEDREVMQKLDLPASQVYFEGYTQVLNGKVMFHYRGVVFYL